MRRFLIDTDTASDDAVALLMALREPDVRVEAITVVAGNCPLEMATKNALICVERAKADQPEVYPGASQPLFRPLRSAEHIHGDDGMGNMLLPNPDRNAQSLHGALAIIEFAKKYPGELEFITLGPLTNLALALQLEPQLSHWVKHLFIMGGAGVGGGNITPVAEFNFWVDAEAAQKVIASDMTKTVVGWDVCMDETFIGPNDMKALNRCGDLGRFAVRCNQTLIEYNAQYGKTGFDLPDPTAVAVALYEDIVEQAFSAYTEVDYKGELGYGQYLIDQRDACGKAHNACVVTKINADKFKGALLRLLAD